MFAISTLEDVVRIPPSLFGTSLKKAAINILKSKYESMVNADLGYIIMILDAKVDTTGKVIAGDAGTFHKVSFDSLTYYPKLQVMDDYLKSDVASGMIIANESGKTLRVGSTIRARITAVSLGKASMMGKIGITCRQPFLGADEWIEAEVKKSTKSDEKEEKVEVKEKKKKEEKVEVKEKKKVEEKVEVKEK